VEANRNNETGNTGSPGVSDQAQQDREPIRILVADDDPVSRHLVEKILTRFGHTPLVAKNGEEAWRMLRESQAQLVVADWMMPKIDGLELCRRVRSGDYPGYVYIILLTSKHEKTDVVRGMEAGANDYLVKPFDADELWARIRAGERIVRLEQELAERNRLLEERNAELDRISRTDPLMGIGNRRSFEDDIVDVHMRSVRYARPYAIAIYDLDHFKTYNDTCGHEFGDQILRDVAITISEAIRSSDGVYRYGGEEIVVVMPEVELEEAVQSVERITAAIREAQIGRMKDGPLQAITISCGVSAWSAKLEGAADWKDVLETSDSALYMAKASGRNCVMSLPCKIRSLPRETTVPAENEQGQEEKRAQTG
jgi:diguanylate cyclase (GGDEF)-like protein